MSSTFLLIFIHIYHCVVGEFKCTTIDGNPSGSQNNSISIAICPTNYVIISCGIKIEVPSDLSHQNTYGTFLHLNNNSCSSKNPPTMKGVTVYARCCNTNSDIYNIKINHIHSEISDTGHQQQTAISCGNNQTLLACSTYSYDSYNIDGGYPESDGILSILSGATLPSNHTNDDHASECVSETGIDSMHGVYAEAICAEADIKLGPTDIQCTSIYGASSSESAWSNLTCPNEHPIMTSCQAISDYMNCDQAYIQDNECKSHRIDDHTHTAVAIWYRQNMWKL